jgi:hypothetical protein
MRQEGPVGQVYTGRDYTGAEVTVALLNEPASNDPNLRNAFADAVWRHSVGSTAGQATVYAADLNGPRPWAATRVEPGLAGAEQLLVGLAPPAGPAGMPGSPPASPAGMPGSMPPMSPPIPGYQQEFPTPSPAPGKSGSPWPWLIGVGAGVVVLVLLIVVGVLGARALRDDPVAGPTTQPAPPQTTAGPSSPTPPATTEPPPTGEPELRDVEPVSVVTGSPSWGGSDETYTMSFLGWPFAFRAGGDWDCLKADPVDRFPGAELWVCGPLSRPEERTTVMLWECPTTCTANEQQDMIETWLDDPDEAIQWGQSPTFYVEYDPNDEDKYAIDLGHFFGPAGTEELNWMVGVYVEAPPDDREDVQKTLNDIVGQAGVPS